MRISENGVSFSGSGGHNHNGVNSSVIDVGSYSLFDFSLGYKGSQSRINAQGTNQGALEDWVIRIVNSKVLQPAGLTLDPNTLSGKSIRSNTITATELQANTITADEIAANTITANELSSNIVLINNIIRSNNYDGTIAANGVIAGSGTVGWAITHAGSAEFSSASIRGAITANSVSTPGIDILANGAISSTNFNVTATGNITAVNASITGSISASSGNIGGYSISGGALNASSSGTVGLNTWTGNISLDTSSRIVTNTYYVDNVNGFGFHNVITFNDVGTPDGGIKVERGVYDTAFTTITSYAGYKYGPLGPQNLSDERLKNILNKEVDALSTLNQISIVPFTYKRDGFNSEKLGFIAQQLHTVLPDMVIVGSENPEERPWTIVMEQIIPYLTKAMQEISDKIDNFNARLQALEEV
jgi:hypothetical protein